MSNFPYQIKDINLFLEAFTHPSKSKNKKTTTYERLEFLGDSVVNLLVAKLIYETYPNANEGILSRMISSLVKTDTLAAISIDLKLSEHLMIEKGEDNQQLRANPKLHENIFESYLGACFLEIGFESTYKIFSPLWKQYLISMDIENIQDPKSKLQEYCQNLFKVAPTYKVIHEEGRPHDKLFVVEVCLPNALKAQAEAKTIKQAEKNAASLLLAKIN